MIIPGSVAQVRETRKKIPCGVIHSGVNRPMTNDKHAAPVPFLSRRVKRCSTTYTFSGFTKDAKGEDVAHQGVDRVYLKKDPLERARGERVALLCVFSKCHSRPVTSRGSTLRLRGEALLIDELFIVEWDLFSRGIR